MIVKELSGISEEVVAVAAGNEHSLALLKNGKVLAWGKKTSAGFAGRSKKIAAEGSQGPYSSF
jgi:alpha-tubulin suppressor-like RCC1 family protein